MTLWVVGRVGGEEWQVLGVYSTRELAIARCRTPDDFIGPIELDVDLPEDPEGWPGGECPLRTTREFPPPTESSDA